MEDHLIQAFLNKCLLTLAKPNSGSNYSDLIKHNIAEKTREDEVLVVGMKQMSHQLDENCW
jgi:hypothetical protein